MRPSGTQAVIIGNGSSVDVMPPEFWRQDLLYIGTNRALCIKSLQGVRLDAVVMRDQWSRLWKSNKVSRRYHVKCWQQANCYKVGPAHKRYTVCDEYVRMVKGWQFVEDRDKEEEAAVMKNTSVAIMAANVAFHWGVRDFFFIGIDYHGSHAEMLDGFDVSTGNEWRYVKPVSPCIEKDFGRMRQAVESVDGRCLNCSPDTQLKALELCDFAAMREMIGCGSSSPRRLQPVSS